ncbi:MAG: bifunctional ornithine acetyltransferase/N-acetylglutamate synthase, partial [Spongiibacteraceae bacterium]
SNAEPEAWLQAAGGLLTTDTRPKASSRQFRGQVEIITIPGISKGAGMIKPNMATMLAFVATDAAISQALLQGLLDEAAEQSFNRITVDGDTSTNDACMLIATGRANVATVSTADGELYELLRTNINALFLELAQAIVRDGEGATKFVAVSVCGASSIKEALQVAYCVAESPLVKTALFASDPNWGRILAAIGRAGVSDLCVEDISVFLGDVLIVEQGGRASAYREDDGAAVMAKDELQIRIELNRGNCDETVWTTDLSYDYVKINAEYRT